MKWRVLSNILYSTQSDVHGSIEPSLPLSIKKMFDPAWQNTWLIMFLSVTKEIVTKQIILLRKTIFARRNSKVDSYFSFVLKKKLQSSTELIHQHSHCSTGNICSLYHHYWHGQGKLCINGEYFSHQQWKNKETKGILIKYMYFLWKSDIFHSSTLTLHKWWHHLTYLNLRYLLEKPICLL